MAPNLVSAKAGMPQILFFRRSEGKRHNWSTRSHGLLSLNLIMTAILKNYEEGDWFRQVPVPFCFDVV